MSREEAIVQLKYLRRSSDCEDAIDIAIRSIEVLKCLECKLRHEYDTNEIKDDRVVDMEDYFHGLKRALSLIETLNKELSTNS